MFDINSGILGFLLSVVGIVVIPFYLMHKDTQYRDRRDEHERKKNRPQ